MPHGRRARQLRRPDRQVGVDIDPRAPAAVEPVVGTPRLARDERDPQVLAVGQAEGARRPRRESARPATRRRPAGGRRRPRTGRPTPSSRSASGPSPGSKLVDRGRGRRRTGRPGPRRRVCEAARHVLQVRQRLARERRGLGLERDQLDVEPGPAVGFGDLGRQTVPQGGRVLAQAGRRAKLLHVDRRLEIRRPEVPVDEPRDVLVEAEARGGGSRGRSGRAPGPCGSRRPPGPAPTRSPLHLLGAWRARHVVTEVRVGLAARLGEPLGERGIHRQAGPVGRTVRATRGRLGRVDAERVGASIRSRGAEAGPPVSPTNGIRCRSTASRLIRRAAVFCSATSRT